MSANKKKIRDLFDVILKLKSVDDCEKFFTDLCTPSELEAMADRWEVVNHLIKGSPYRTINENTGISTATITRVARSLEYGDGYKMALTKLKRK